MWFTGSVDAFVDGDDLCAGCANCCRAEGLLVTEDELARLPRLQPFVAGEEGPFVKVDMPGGCPYLLPNGWCGTFETRPFDCSLFPVQLGRIERAPDGAVTAAWRWGEAPECPSREAFVRRGVSESQLVAFGGWIGAATRTTGVRVVHDPSTQRPRARARRALFRFLRRTHLYEPAHRLLTGVRLARRVRPRRG